ncbi:MAG: serine/threonine-protein kinase [Myxococcota bacterium]
MSQSGSVNVGPSPTLWETDGSEPVEERSGALEPGETLGRYVVLYRLGTGGMGIVYAAYDPQLDRKVALKLLRHLSSNPKRRKRATERLLREARSMARLTHPNVITVHDVAVLDARIFVAMEHVDGVTLTRHLAAGEQPWRKVIDILAAAGRGLAAAHEAGLVHRDFKPDNVMLARDGRVLVMDFGLARALAPDDNESIASMSMPSTAVSDIEADSSGVLALQSQGKAPASRVAGTPGYMAPEQHRGKPTDSRTDQFSFCVTLYEALYRQRPFKGETPDEIADEIEAERIVEPPTDAGVPSWVRAILFRGMRPRAEDRWESMSQLLAALGNDPAVHRRRFLLWGGVSTLVACTAGAGVYLQATSDAPCVRADDRMDGVWGDRQRNRVASAFAAVDRPYAQDALQGTVEGMDRYADEWLTMQFEACEANRVRGEQSDDLFDLRMDCLNRRHAELRALSELFGEADVSVVKESVVATSKLTPLGACADVQLLRTTVPMPDDPDVRKAVTEIRDELARSKAYQDGARYDRAIELVAAVLDDARGVDYPPVLAEALVQRGSTLLAKGDFTEAEPALREALHTAAAGRHDEVAARAWIEMAHVLSQSGQIERSAEAVEAANAAVLRTGEPPELVARLSNVRGAVLFSQGDYARSQLAFERALSMQQKVYGENHASVAGFYNNLALAHGQQGDLVESMRFLKRAVELEEKVLGSVHPRIALIVGNLGAMEAQQGHLEAAEKQIRRSIDIFERSVCNAPRLGVMMNNLGELRLQSGDPDGAKPHFLRAIANQESSLGDHPDLGLSLANLGIAHALSGEPDKALEVLDRSATVLRDTSGTEHPTYAHVLAARGEAEFRLGRHESAVEHFGQAIDRLTRVPGMMLSSDIGWMRFGLARALVAAGRDHERARSLAEQGRLEISKRPPVPLRKQWLEEITAWQAKHFPVP